MKQRRFAKVLSWILAALLVISLLPTSMLQVRAEEGETSNRAWEWTRLAGKNRYETTVLGTQEVYEEGSCSTIIVAAANGQKFPDALAGSALAGVYECPILLTHGEKLSAEPKAEIQRLAAPGCKVLILGGTGAVTETVENAIKGLGIEGLTTERVAGTNREATAEAVFDRGLEAGGFKTKGTVIITTGYAFADVLSISPYAYASKTPIVLVKKGGSMNSAIKAIIKKIDPAKAILVGGNSAVNSDSEAWLTNQGIETFRLAGDNRYVTSAEIMKWELGLMSDAAIQPEVEMTIEGMGIATGTSFPDALGAASLLGKTASPLLLVADNNKNNKAATQANIDELIAPYAADMTKGYIFGGTGAVSAQIEGWLNEAVPEAGPTIYETPEEILKALYELGDNEVLSDGYLYELEGKITAVVTPYSSRYNNITVNMEIEGLEQYPVQAFRLTAEANTEMSEAVKVLKTGDTIKVKGALKNYVSSSGVSTKEFDAGCLLIGYTEGTQGPTIYETPEEILKALYELGDNEVLSDGYLYELEGTITEVNTDYSEQFNNISVTIVVEGFDEYPVQAYRLTAEGTNEEMSAALKVLKVGDTIKVKGALKNYVNSSGVSTKEFDAGCLLIDYTAGGEEPPVVSDQEKVNAEKDALTLTEEGEALTVSEDVEITLPAPKTYPEVQIAWQSDKENVVVNDGKLVITQVEEEVVANVTATLSLNEASAEKTFVITVKAKGSEEPEKAVWTKVAWADITEDDTIAITVTKSGTNAGTYVLTSDVTSAGGPPAATSTVTPQDGKFETETADKYAWVRIPTEGGYLFQRGDDPTLYLYMFENNNGVRIGTLEAAGDGAVLTLDENSGYLRAVAFERYLGVFNAQDWRCYNSPTASNIANQTIEFWKFSEGGEEPPVEPNDEEKVQTEYENLSLGPISAGPGVVSEDMTYELPVAGGTYSDVSISWESDADSVAVVDKNLVITQIETEVVAHVKATLVLNDATKEKTFTITVTAKASGEEETVTESFVIGELPQYTAETNIDSLTVGNIQITFDQGSAGTHTRFWKNDIRTYQGSTFTIATVDGTRIKSIAITFSSGYTNCTPEPNTYTLDGTVGTWTGNQNSVSFACAGQVRIVSMEVIYVKGE